MPTFGTTTTSSNNLLTIDANGAGGQVITAPGNVGTVASVSGYMEAPIGKSVKAIIALASTGVIVANGTGGAATGTGAREWLTSTFASPPTLTPEASYWVGFVAESNTTKLYGPASGGTYWSDATNSYASPQDPTGGSTGTGNLSIYATYTPKDAGDGYILVCSD